MSDKNLPPTWLSWAMAGATLFAVLDLPYGYYQFLRIVVTGYSAFLIVHYTRVNHTYMQWLFGLAFVIYNPLFVIAMSKQFHSLFNVVASALIIAEWYMRQSDEFITELRSYISDVLKRRIVNGPDNNSLIDALKFRLIWTIVASLIIVVLIAISSELLGREEVGSASDPSEGASSLTTALDDALRRAQAFDLVERVEVDRNESAIDFETPAGVEAVPLKSLPSPDIPADATTYREPLDSPNWRGSRGRCSLFVGGQAYIDGDCWVRLEDDGSFQIMSLDESYLAQLSRVGADGLGHWNETPGSTHVQVGLGKMIRNGACWKNADAEICAWSG